MSGGVGSGAAVRQGYLRKLKTMKRKYFVLRGETSEHTAKLEYYESEKKFRTGSVPKHSIPIRSCFNITRRLDLKQRHVIAFYTKEEQFCVVADGEDELHAWLADILKIHLNKNFSQEQHPTQHVWQVNVQKKGLGASKNIIGLHNLCLTDKSLRLVKIRANNNVIGEPLTDGTEFSLRNIRRCGDSESFFYMEVGRQTATGAGELWMHTDDVNIAQSMHSTIYRAMCNCKDEKEMPRNRSSSTCSDPRTVSARRSTYSTDRHVAAVTNNGKAALCVGSCIKQCVCATTYSIEDSAALVAPLTPQNALDNQANNILTSDNKYKENIRLSHQRTVSLPSSCIYQEPLKIVHERTRSAPLTGDEVDAMIEKPTRYSSCKTVNGTDVYSKKSGQWSRRASTGTKMAKLSPAHIKNPPPRNRSDSMPSRSCPPMDAERTPSRHLPDVDGNDTLESRDEIDASDRHRTLPIPEETDYCDMTPVDGLNRLMRKMSASSAANSPVVDAADRELQGGYVPMGPMSTTTLSASSGSVCSGTPSTDPRFSEYNLEPATSHISELEEVRPPRAYSVGSRPARPAPPAPDAAAAARARACSLGARGRANTNSSLARGPAPANSAPQLPPAASADLMELDFSNNSPKTRHIVTGTPPQASSMPPPRGIAARPRPKVDEYVDMSPRAVGYAEMTPLGASPAAPAPAPAAAPEGYVEMNYSRERAASRPITIAAERGAPARAHPPHPPHPAAERDRGTPLGSQTIFPFSLDSPAEPPPPDPSGEEPAPHPLTTVRELSEEGARRSPDPPPAAPSPPHYVALRTPSTRPIATPTKRDAAVELSCNRAATKQWTVDDAPALVIRANAAAPAKFSVEPPPPPASECPVLDYAALDLAPPPAATAAAPPAPQAPAPRAYTQIDFARSEQLHTAGADDND